MSNTDLGGSSGHARESALQSLRFVIIFEPECGIQPQGGSQTEGKPMKGPMSNFLSRLALSLRFIVIAPMASSFLNYLAGLGVPSHCTVRAAEENLATRESCEPLDVTIGVFDNFAQEFKERHDHTFFEGEKVLIQIVARRKGYLYVFCRDTNGRLVCLLPNQYRCDNHVEAAQLLTIPGHNDGFALSVTPPFGPETILAVLTDTAIDPHRIMALAANCPLSSVRDLKSFIESHLQNELGSSDSCSVKATTIVTLARENQPQLSSRRFGLFVGIGKYTHPRPFRRLASSAIDARDMARVLSELGGLTSVRLLVDEEATYRAIGEAWQCLAESVTENDEVFIYWSGHGGKCADLDGDEKDGYDEYLVAYDSNFGDPHSLILDDDLGKWVKSLPSRRVCFILDVCYSGGLAEGTRAGGTARSASGDSNEIRQFARDLLFDDDIHTRDITKEDAVVLASCAESEISIVMDADAANPPHSVMTSFLLKHLRQAGPLTVREAYHRIAPSVDDYIRQKFANAMWQSVQLIPEEGGGTIYLKLPQKP